MDLLLFLVVSAVIFGVAYRLMGAWLARAFGLRSTETTPAFRQRDGLDYEPARTAALLPQHFSAIAAAGPIVGPILAGVQFGWGPAWLWVIFGSILIGGIHDFTALVASVRHDARSVAELVRRYMNPRAYFLFLLFIWFALIYVIIAFADVTAGTFVQAAAVATPGVTPDAAPGPAVATSSILYLLLAVAMGLALRLGGMNPVKAKLIFLPLVAVAILAGPLLPFDLGALTGLADAATTQRAWNLLLLGYCLLAAMAPVWLLLQPRGELGGYFLYIVMAVAIGGILAGALSGSTHIAAPFFRGWQPDAAGGVPTPLFPILFITVACGACSGFHSIVASGTTSKQLRRESDARAVGYGSMLLEGLFACLSLATVMVLVDAKGKPDLIYAQGIARFGEAVLAPLGLSGPVLHGYMLKFALLCFATFVFDTLDACTRLSRYVLMELLGWTTRAQAWLATVLCLALPATVVMLPPVLVDGKAQPLWRVFWNIFGSSNQLLAALTLLGVTVWLARRRGASPHGAVDAAAPRRLYWIALAPTLFMMAMTLWSLVLMLGPWLRMRQAGAAIAPLQHVQFAITVSLIVLALWLIAEALITWRGMKGDRWPDGEAEIATGAVPAAAGR